MDELRSKYKINDFYFYISNYSLDDSSKQLCLQVELHVYKMFILYFYVSSWYLLRSHDINYRTNLPAAGFEGDLGMLMGGTKFGLLSENWPGHPHTNVITYCSQRTGLLIHVGPIAIYKLCFNTTQNAFTHFITWMYWRIWMWLET